MTERDAQFVAVYRANRFDDQRGWYTNRTDEYERAHDQILTATGVALFLSSAAGAVAAADLAGLRVAWAVLAAIASAVATFLGGYDQLIGYERNIKIYRDAQAALGELRARAPWLSEEHDDHEDIVQFVTAVEDVFEHEITQWGQLTLTPAQRDNGAPPNMSSRF